MATTGGKKLATSSEKGSELVIDFPCTPCFKDGITEEGVNYCVECSEYFCLACTKDHKKCEATSGHTVAERTHAQAAGGEPSTDLLLNEECREQHVEKITTDCYDNDVVFGSTCAAVDQRMPDQRLTRQPLHGGKSPARQRKNVKKTKDENEDDLDNTPKRRGRRAANKLYPDLSPAITDEEEELEEEDDETDGSQDRSLPPDKVKYRGDQPKEVVKDQGSNSSMLFLAAGILCIVIGLVWYLNNGTVPPPSEKPTDEQKIDYYELFKPKFDALKNQFPAQSKRFWKIIGSPIRRVLETEENSDAPAILLLGVPVNGNSTARCLSRRLVEKINSVYRVRAEFYIDVHDILQSSPARTKLELDNNLRQVLSAGKGVVLDHLERLPPEGALLLHGYCDGDNAPFKMSVIVLVFHTDKEFASLSDRTFEDHLTDLWEEGLGPDEMPALRARVANSVAIVKPEANVVC